MRQLLLILLVALLAGPPGVHAQTSQGKPPNVVFILADDIGYGDLGCYGATKVKTPNLDRLASSGRRFTDAHTPSAMCTPTRYALMTGRYAWRHPPTAKGVLSGVAPLALNPNELTLPGLFQRAGYVTGAIGKWHLGLGTSVTNYNQDIKPGPLEVGFHYFFGLPATGDRVPCVYVENHRVVNYDPADPIQVSYATKVGDEPTGKDHPKLLTKMRPSRGHDATIINGISRIGWMTGGKKARWIDEDMADVFTQKAVSFLEKNKDRPFFLYFAAHDIHVPRVPHPRFKGTSEHGTRGDVIQELDWCVGEILKTLDRLGIADNTLVIFTSDNGGVMDDGYEDGSGSDTSSHRCNGVLRGFKGGLYEGGHRVPFLLRWSGRVPAGRSDGLISLVDMVASFSTLLKQPLPRGGGPDSVDLSAALLAQAGAKTRDHLVLHSGGWGFGFRQGNWMLLPAQPKGKTKTTELYDLANDLNQTRNLATAHPERVREMESILERLKSGER